MSSDSQAEHNNICGFLRFASASIARTIVLVNRDLSVNPRTDIIEASSFAYHTITSFVLTLLTKLHLYRWIYQHPEDNHGSAIWMEALLATTRYPMQDWEKNSAGEIA